MYLNDSKSQIGNLKFNRFPLATFRGSRDRVDDSLCGEAVCEIARNIQRIRPGANRCEERIGHYTKRRRERPRVIRRLETRTQSGRNFKFAELLFAAPRAQEQAGPVGAIARIGVKYESTVATVEINSDRVAAPDRHLR